MPHCHHIIHQSFGGQRASSYNNAWLRLSVHRIMQTGLLTCQKATHHRQILIGQFADFFRAVLTAKPPLAVSVTPDVSVLFFKRAACLLFPP